jgi:ribosome-associated translation inhibitor RaiA
MNLRDKAGNLLTSTKEGKAKLIKQLNKNKEKLKNHALEYNRLVNEFSGLEREKDLSRE